MVVRSTTGWNTGKDGPVITRWRRARRSSEALRRSRPGSSKVVMVGASSLVVTMAAVTRSARSSTTKPSALIMTTPSTRPGVDSGTQAAVAGPGSKGAGPRTCTRHGWVVSAHGPPLARW
jgi:hypothetical protein